MLPVSSALLTGLIVAAGIFSLGLGVVHVAAPVIFRFPAAIGDDRDAPPLGRIRFPAVPYELRRSDLRGITWIMSNAASYVIVSIGLIDLVWAAGWRGLPVPLVSGWIAGWWAVRAIGEGFVGRRTVDLALAGLFLALATLHGLIAWAEL